MNPTTLQNNILAAICPSAAIKAWCQSNYSQDHTVFSGLNIENPPDDNDYPLIVVFPVDKEGGRAAENEEVTIGLAVGVLDDTTNPEPSYANLVEYQGITRREELRQLVLTAFGQASLDDGFVVEIVTEYSPVEDFPIFMAVMSIKIIRPYQRGENRLI